MNDPCTEIQDELLDLQWSQQQRVQAQRVLTHLQTCEACRQAADDYALLRGVLASPATAEPAGGWPAYEEWLLHTIRAPSRFRWWLSIAAGLLIAITAANAWMLL